MFFCQSCQNYKSAVQWASAGNCTTMSSWLVVMMTSTYIVYCHSALLQTQVQCTCIQHCPQKWRSRRQAQPLGRECILHWSIINVYIVQQYPTVVFWYTVTYQMPTGFSYVRMKMNVAKHLVVRNINGTGESEAYLLQWTQTAAIWAIL